MARESGEDDELVRRAAGGDEAAAAELFGRHRDRLQRLVRLRLDRRLQGRIDTSDVLQETYLDLVQQLPAFAARGDMPVFLWLRLLAGQRLSRLHRQHLGAAMRDAGREVPIDGGATPEAGSASLAVRLLGRLTTASQAADRAERKRLLEQTLDAMDPIDREIIALRNFEELTNAEAAAVLGLSKTAASNRYVRALARLQNALRDVPGLLDRSHD